MSRMIEKERARARDLAEDGDGDGLYLAPVGNLCKCICGGPWTWSRNFASGFSCRATAEASESASECIASCREYRVSSTQQQVAGVEWYSIMAGNMYRTCLCVSGAGKQYANIWNVISLPADSLAAGHCMRRQSRLHSPPDGQEEADAKRRLLL